jgi:hypothetical protein
MKPFLIMEKIADHTLSQLKFELQSQGHKLTGALERSLEWRGRSFEGGLVISFLAEKYALPVNTGVRSNRIPYTPGQARAKKSKYIQALVRYAKIRFRVTEKQALGIAFAIARKHKKEGMPTFASFKYSKTRERTGFIADALELAEPHTLRVLREYEIELQNMMI